MAYAVPGSVYALGIGPGFAPGTNIRIRIPVRNVTGPERLRLNLEVWEGRFWIGPVGVVASYTEEVIVPTGSAGYFDFYHIVIEGPNWGEGQYRRDLRATLEYWDATDSAWVKYSDYGWEDVYHVAAGYLLVQEHVYPYAEQYVGDAEECVCTFTLGLEQIAVPWLGSSIINAFAEAITEEGAHMLKLQVYVDTGPLIHSDYKVVATATASPVPWLAVIAVVLLILFAIATIAYVILTITRFQWGGEPPTDGNFILVHDYTYPYAEEYYGEVEECTFIFALLPEQVPGMDWVSEKIAQAFANEVTKEGSQMIKLQVYEDTTPALWTDYKVIATATATPVAWKLLIAAVLLILFLVAITFTIIEIKKFLWGEPEGPPGILDMLPMLMVIMMMGMMMTMMEGEGEVGGMF